MDVTPLLVVNKLKSFLLILNVFMFVPEHMQLQVEVKINKALVVINNNNNLK